MRCIEVLRTPSHLNVGSFAPLSEHIRCLNDVIEEEYLTIKLDLHVHASERSGCSVSGEETMIQAAQRAGLDALAFTDHHRLVPSTRLIELNEKFAPFRVYSGIEITSREGEDCLVYGIQDPILEDRYWRYDELVGFVRQKHGFIVLAHPFRFASTIRVDLSAYPPDGVEVRSQNTPREREDDIRRIAEELGVALLVNSDAHSSAAIGRYYNEIPALLDGDQGLMDCLMGLKLMRA